jgi:hypothetical protein
MRTMNGQLLWSRPDYGMQAYCGLQLLKCCAEVMLASCSFGRDCCLHVLCVRVYVVGRLTLMGAKGSTTASPALLLVVRRVLVLGRYPRLLPGKPNTPNNNRSASGQQGLV